ncbi:MAG: hypothetical protein IJW71_03075 [Clostridia bacterium]|nr:hypothetical protein [Clostridia bacterium]
MQLKGEAYSERLESFSDSTLELVADIMTMSKEKVFQMNRAIANSDYTEEQIVKLLTELKSSK